MCLQQPTLCPLFGFLPKMADMNATETPAKQGTEYVCVAECFPFSQLPHPIYAA
jgi:hypothetical protein